MTRLPERRMTVSTHSLKGALCMWWWTRRKVNEAVEDLQSIDRRTREDAFATIVRLADEATVLKMIADLREPVWHERHYESDDDPHEVETLIEALVRLKKWSLRPLLASLNEPFRWRVYAIDALGCMADPQAIPHFLALLKRLKEKRSERGEVAAVATALGRIGGPQAVPTLLGILKEPPQIPRDSGDIQAVAAALGKLGDVRAVPPLLGLLSSPSCLDQEKVEVVQALQAIRDPRAVPVLLESLSKARHHNLRLATMRALGEFGDKRAVPALQSFVASLQQEPISHDPVNKSLKDGLQTAATEELARLKAL